MKLIPIFVAVVIVALLIALAILPIYPSSDTPNAEGFQLFSADKHCDVTGFNPGKTTTYCQINSDAPVGSKLVVDIELLYRAIIPDGPIAACTNLAIGSSPADSSATLTYTQHYLGFETSIHVCLYSEQSVIIHFTVPRIASEPTTYEITALGGVSTVRVTTGMA